MKKTIKMSKVSVSIVAALLLVCSSAIATTFQDIEKTCPLCNEIVRGHLPGSTFVPGISPDFRPLGGIDWTVSSLLECKQCGFVSLGSRFDDSSGLNTNMVKRVLAELETTPLFAHLDRAMIIEQNWKKDTYLLAWLALAAKWIADDTGEQDLVNKRLEEAIRAHEHILAVEKLEKSEEAKFLYLIGELNRQAGQKSKALEFFAKAEKYENQELLSLIKQQRAVVEGQGKLPDLTDLQKATDNEKLAAISYLRERKDPETLTFLRQFCLNCPHDYRERSIDALYGDAPLKQHIPLYLEGLRNEHYRTVQGSARALEELQVSEAAPIIADVLLDPVKYTDYLLSYALVATATSNEVEFLVTTSEMETHLIFNALINTRSTNAVPHILDLFGKLKRVHGFYDAYGEEQFKKAAEFPALQNALPDLSKASPTNAAAIFKAESLRFASDSGVDQQLLAGMKRGGELGNTCALVLAARGNPASKKILLNGLPKNLESAEYIYPILEPADYDLLLQKMKSARIEKEKEIANIRALQKKSLADPNLDDQLKKYFDEDMQQEIESLEWGLRRLPNKWVGLLATTGNSEAKPLCLELLSASYPDTSLLAIPAFSHIYDDEVEQALLDACTKEDVTWVAEEVFKALGENGSEKTADKMLKLVEQPTLVSFKLHWLDAMKKLAPVKARPCAELWASSPSLTLSKAAKEFLESGQPGTGL